MELASSGKQGREAVREERKSDVLTACCISLSGNLTLGSAQVVRGTGVSVHLPRGSEVLQPWTNLKLPLWLPEGTVSPDWRPQFPGFPSGPWGWLPISHRISHSPLASAQGSRCQWSPQALAPDPATRWEPKATFNYCLGLCNQTNWTMDHAWDASLGSASPSVLSLDPLSSLDALQVGCKCGPLRTPLSEPPSHKRSSLVPLQQPTLWLRLCKPHFPHQSCIQGRCLDIANRNLTFTNGPSEIRVRRTEFKF
jgi:hypothetical protein